MPDPHGHGPRLKRALWAMAAFLVGFAILIVIVSHYYLLPAMEAARGADLSGRRQLSAFSTLLLAVVLFVLLVGLGMTFRVHRLFFPRPMPPPPPRTQHVDAWAESARRVPTPPVDEGDDDDEDDDFG